jgi:hypothetical protein
MNSPQYQQHFNAYIQLNQEEDRLISLLHSRESVQNDLKVLMKIAENKLSHLNNAIKIASEMPERLDVMWIEEESECVATLNKFLSPVKLRINADVLKSGHKYQVRVYLCLTPSNSVVVMTSDSMQPILQGRTVQEEVDGYVKFDRLKIMEVSSNYQFQSFRLLFQLEDITVGTPVRVGNTVMSTPIQVIYTEKRKHQDSDAPLTRNKRCREDSQFVDITALLVLPQKEAAAKLGISESMLCKRFKESTRRKWPYRYLRKIEKMIHKMESSDLTSEELKKLEFLREERSSCLKPMKIRVTGRTSSQEFPLNDIYNVSTFSNSFAKPNTITNTESTSASDSVEEDQDNENELENIAMALQSLKNFK